MIKHYMGIGMYNIPSFTDWSIYGYVMDDFGNLVAINEHQFDQRVYFIDGVML